MCIEQDFSHFPNQLFNQARLWMWVVELVVRITSSHMPQSRMNGSRRRRPRSVCLHGNLSKLLSIDTDHPCGWHPPQVALRPWGHCVCWVTFKSARHQTFARFEQYTPLAFLTAIKQFEEKEQRLCTATLPPRLCSLDPGTLQHIVDRLQSLVRSNHNDFGGYISTGPEQRFPVWVKGWQTSH